MMSLDYRDARIKQLEAQLRSRLHEESMCADHIKGGVTLEYVWRFGPRGDMTMHSDAAERKLSEIAKAVVFHALTSGEASVTLTVRRSGRAAAAEGADALTGDADGSL